MPKAKALVAGEVVAESDKTVLVEGNHYFPKADIDMSKLSPHEGLETVCHWKGTASYFDVNAGGQHLDGAAFEYKAPLEAAAQIKDHVAFWRGVHVEEEV